MRSVQSLIAFLRRAFATALFAPVLVVLVVSAPLARAQQSIERDGIVLFWGLVPAAIVSDKHPLTAMHGVVPRDGGQIHHLVVALFRKADGSRIADAVVRAQLREIGLVDAAPKYLTPMTINELASYGQLFSTAKDGPYRFRVFVRLIDRAAEIEFPIDAASPHRKTD